MGSRLIKPAQVRHGKAVFLTNRERELLDEAIGEYVEELREDDDPQNNALADEYEVIQEQVGR